MVERVELEFVLSLRSVFLSTPKLPFRLEPVLFRRSHRATAPVPELVGQRFDLLVIERRCTLVVRLRCCTDRLGWRGPLMGLLMKRVLTG